MDPVPISQLEREVPTDRALWARAVAGDGEAFGVIYDRHIKAIHAYCSRRTGSTDTAEDLVSIVFLEAWRRRAEVELYDDSALPWLYGVARFTIMRRARTTARHRAALDRLPASMHLPDHADEVAEKIDSAVAVEEVANAFRQLSPQDQEVLLLCIWQELDYAAAAIALSVPIGTVRSRLSRAKSRLGKLLLKESVASEGARS